MTDCSTPERGARKKLAPSRVSLGCIPRQRMSLGLAQRLEWGATPSEQLRRASPLDALVCIRGVERGDFVHRRRLDFANSVSLRNLSRRAACFL
jgi:hypothetical protein